jgi:hypothetical protein
LALQAALALAYTHVHTYTVAASADLARRAITYGMCRAGAERPCPPQVPHDDHAKCSLCWSMNLVSTALLHAPPSIPLPHPEIGMLAPARAAASVHGVSSVHFQARAPPRA